MNSLEKNTAFSNEPPHVNPPRLFPQPIPSSVDSPEKFPLAPQVPGVPFFGNALSLKKEPINFLVDCAHRYGNTFRLKGPGEKVTVVAGPEGWDLVRNDGENPLHRREIFNAFSSEAGVDIFGIQGAAHTDLRNLIKLAYSRQTAAQFSASMEKVVKKIVHKWPPNHEFLLFNLTSELAISCAMVMATPVDLTSHLSDFNHFGNVVMYAVTKGKPPWILWFPKYKKARKQVYELLDEVIIRHRQGEFAHKPELFMTDAFLESKSKSGQPLTDRDIRGGLAYALCGTEIYVGRLMAFMLFELLKNRALLESVRKEVDAAFGGMRTVDAALFTRMPNLRGTYLEALRMYPLLPGLPFRAEKDFTVGEYRVPKNDLVLVTPVPAHFNEKFYPNPFVFDASRCMAPRNEHLQPKSFAPFGLGKRTCAAGGLVEVATLTAISTVLKEVDLELVKPTYQIRVEPRPLIAPKDRLPIRILAPRQIDPNRFNRAALSESRDLATVIEDDQKVLTLPTTLLAQYDPGSIVIQEGDKADFYFVILDGIAQVRKGNGDSAKVVAELVAGRTFGEIGLLKGVPRTASVVAQTKLTVLKVARDEFLQWVSCSDRIGDELGALLQKDYYKKAISTALPNVNLGVLEKHTDGIKVERFQAGDTLIREGELADKFYIISSGQAEVYKSKDGHQVFQAILGAGEYFGEWGILNQQPRSATVVAKTMLDLLAIERECFIKMLNESGKTREDVALTVCRRLFGDLTKVKNS